MYRYNSSSIINDFIKPVFRILYLHMCLHKISIIKECSAADKNYKRLNFLVYILLFIKLTESDSKQFQINLISIKTRSVCLISNTFLFNWIFFLIKSKILLMKMMFECYFSLILYCI